MKGLLLIDGYYAVMSGRCCFPPRNFLVKKALRVPKEEGVSPLSPWERAEGEGSFKFIKHILCVTSIFKMVFVLSA